MKRFIRFNLRQWAVIHGLAAGLVIGIASILMEVNVPDDPTPDWLPWVLYGLGLVLMIAALWYNRDDEEGQ